MTWKNESRRHALASKGIKTGTKVPMSRAMQYKKKMLSPLVKQNEYYEKLILDSLTYEDNDAQGNVIDVTPKTPKGQLERFNDDFKRWRKGDATEERKSEQEARASYLAGLPTNIPYTNNEIIRVAEESGSLRKNATEKEVDRILTNYYNYMSNQIGRLNRKYKVE